MGSLTTAGPGNGDNPGTNQDLTFTKNLFLVDYICFGQKKNASFRVTSSVFSGSVGRQTFFI